MTKYLYIKESEKNKIPETNKINEIVMENENEYLKIQLLLSTVTEDDVIYVYSFSNLGKSNVEIVKILDHMYKNYLNIYSFGEGIATYHNSFYDFLNGMKCVVNMEKKRTSDRLQKAQKKSRESGTKWGRKASTEDEIYKKAIEEYNKGGYSVPEILKIFNLKERTFYRKKKLWGDNVVSPESIRNTEN